jgi:phosphatidylglycerol---prolipoprotein diacylglyceryl transferase
MLIGINPILLGIGPVAVRWFGLLALVGLGVAIGGSLREVRAKHLGSAAFVDALAWGLPAGLISARVFALVGNWEYYLTNTSQVWQLSVDGLSLWGGLIGGGLMAAARLRRDPVRRRRILDATAAYLALGIAIGRVGEFLDGHGQGVPSGLPWATQYTNPLAATPDFGVARHPAQLYDALVALGLCLLLCAWPRRAPAGTRAAAFLVGYGVARVALGAVRLDAAFLLGLQLDQLLALAAIVFGVGFGLRPVVLQHARLRAPWLDHAARQQAARKEDSLAA